MSLLQSNLSACVRAGLLQRRHRGGQRVAAKAELGPLLLSQPEQHPSDYKVFWSTQKDSGKGLHCKISFEERIPLLIKPLI